MRKGPVRFVAHTLDRSGAPIWLLTFLRWLRRNVGEPFELWHAGSDELAPEFAQTCPVHRIGDAIGWRRPSLVYANSAWAHRYLPSMVGPDDVVVSHVHELPMGLRGIDLAPAGAAPNHYVAAAACVRENLVERRGIAADRVTTIHSFIDVAAARRFRSPPSPTPTVVAVGSLNPYKGPDLFLRVAAAYRRRYGRTTRFVWLGGVVPQLAAFRQEVVDAGLSDTVEVVGHVDDVPDRLAAATAFFLPSREDPFPLVCLEAAAVGVPIVAFHQGGAAEFLTPANLVAPFDVDAACDRLHDVVERGALKDAADVLAARVDAFDVEGLAPIVWRVIERFYTMLGV